MHFAILCSRDSWYLRDLQRAAGSRHELTPVAFRDLAAGLLPEGPQFAGGSLDLRGVDALLVRTMTPATLEQVVFRMDVLGRLESAGTTVMNPPRAIEAAVDKYLASAKLAAAGLLTPPTIVCQTVAQGQEAFHQLGGDVVVKPLFGSEGRGIVRLNDEALAQRTFHLLVGLGAVLYLQRFIPHDGYDIRVLIAGEAMWAMRRRNPLDWRTNVSRGATTERVELQTSWAEMARRAAAAVGAPLAGVDLLPARDGRCYTLEVNAVPGWQALSRTLEVDVGRHVIECLESHVIAKRELGR
ncbi:MAG: RimK family alpha-L-glutamate ligase [Planctomycetota bacterium]|nr:MAG: RimK family alpha-L-glutamate ligase [Planctomycetota bacterium]